jgi:glycosyltransferase involved in cell wall biosynthesis
MTGNSDSTLRILLVCHYYPPHVGGIENVVHDEAVRLTALGHEVVVLTSGERTSVTDEDGVRVARIASWNGAEERAGVPYPLPAPGLMRHALRWAGWADVVHIHDCFYLTSWAAGLAAAVRRVPFVLTQHVAMVEHPSGVVRAAQKTVYGTVGRALLRRAATVFTINEYIADFVRDLTAKRVEAVVLGNGVDADLFQPAADRAEQTLLRKRFDLPADRVLVLFVGRLVPKKGFDLLLEAADRSFDLVVVGTGEAGRLDGREGVHYLGGQPPEVVADVYRACDAFALPTTGEIFPLVVKEAMSTALPVVTTDEPDYSTLEPDAAGLTLVEREPSAVRAALVRLAGDEAARREKGARARAYAQRRFSWDEHVAELVRHYSAAAAKR